MFDIKDLITAFECGIDYGLLLAEQERDSEDAFDSVCCLLYSRKHNVPSAPANRRKARSEAWRNAKGASLLRFIELCAGKGE